MAIQWSERTAVLDYAALLDEIADSNGMMIPNEPVADTEPAGQAVLA